MWQSAAIAATKANRTNNNVTAEWSNDKITENYADITGARALCITA